MRLIFHHFIHYSLFCMYKFRILCSNFSTWL